MSNMLNSEVDAEMEKFAITGFDFFKCILNSLSNIREKPQNANIQVEIK